MFAYPELIAKLTRKPELLSLIDNSIAEDIGKNTIPVDDYLQSSGLVNQHMEEFDIDIQAPSEEVALSLFFKAKVQAILVPWLVAGLMNKNVPQSLDRLYLSDHGKGRLQWRESDGFSLDEKSLVESLNQFTQTIADVFTSDFGYGKSDAWGSIGLAVSTPWRVITDSQLAASDLIASYESLMRRSSIDLQGAMLAIPDENGQVRFKRRKSCCHKYLLAGKNHCATCSKVPL